MGTDVSQIACGKKHTLALVPSRGRLYSFGLGGCGQLGNNSFTRLVNISFCQLPFPAVGYKLRNFT